MGFLIKELKRSGHNFKERAYVVGGFIGGVAAPIVAGRYLLPKSENLGQEAVYWGASIILNASSMVVKPHLPIPVYTGIVGSVIGNLGAMISKTKRERKEGLELAVSKIKDSIDSSSADFLSKAIINYRNHRNELSYSLSFGNLKKEKYDERVAELTKNLEVIPFR
ncbi:hypothetical protein KAI04_05125 [Candidatus Pacearchaeota archaeon]|nr:hypothetical protein [Candidatus Pacearchaeota archaeon]